MSGGEILRQLLEEQQSYHRHALDKQRATNELNVASSRGQSPLVKHKGFQDRKRIQTPPRRALSDESPVTESSPFNPAAFTKSNSMSADSTGISNTMFSDSSMSNVMSQDFTNAANVGHQTTNSRMTERLNESKSYHRNVTPFNPSSSPLTSSKHPKSSSAGEDSYHSDRKSKFLDSKLGKRKGKYATSITRSRSLHSAENSRLRPLTKADAGKTAFTNSKQDLHDRAGNLTNGSRIPESASTRSDQFQTYPNEPKKLTDVPQPEEKGRNLKESEFQTHDQQRLVRFQNNMVMIPSGMGGISQPTVQQNTPHGPYYAMVPQNSIGHHHHLPQMHPGTPSKKTSPISQKSSAQPRGPPPPYPQTTGCNESNHPQRPNSLSLSGQVSRKKLEYGGANGNVGGLTSPALASTSMFTSFNFPLSAGTPPPHDIMMRSFPEQGKTTDSNQDSHKAFGVVSPIPEAQFVRNLIGQGFQVSVSSSQPQNPTDHSTKNTSNTTTVSMKQHLRQDQPRSYNNNPNSNTAKQISAPQASYPSQSYGEFQNAQQPASVMVTTNSFSLGKSDSNASSTCSGGSRIARRTKRNSRNFSNVSGSSSSTGNSRPNSSADYLERILSENEALKNQLVAADIKMKKYQHVEKELAQVSQDYQNFRLSVTKSENIQSTLLVQLESATKRTQEENEVLRQRITTLSEMVETLQSSGKIEATSSADVSEYKTKVQELRDRKRQLCEQYDEAVEKISEQAEDISLLNTSLERLQSNVTSLKAELLQKQKMDRCAESLSPFLEALTVTIQSREQTERELNEITVAEQRQSISCNDEGISGMDSADYLSPSSSMSTRRQLVCAHAQMLKWQHAYLQTAILKELSTTSQTSTPNPLYSVLRKHRHAISEPTFCGRLGFDRPPNNTTGRLAADVDTNNSSDHEESIHVRPDDNSDRTSDHNRSSFRERNTGSSVVNAPHSNRTACNAENELSNYSNMHSNSTITKGRLSNADTTASNEADSPSEGYHSQQSSGSPTPSSERSSVHFSEESQLSNLTTPSGGPTSLTTVGTCKTILSKGVDV